jgi:hypothetical protein
LQKKNTKKKKISRKRQKKSTDNYFFKKIEIIMDTSITNTCSSSIINTNKMIPKPKHILSPKNKQQKKNLSLKLTVAEKNILENPKNSQWVKSWIVFYRFCLNDPFVFALVK